CDNAKSNDAMVVELENVLPNFRGQEDQTCCFAHVINLAAKSVLKLFDSPAQIQADNNADNDNEVRDADDDILAFDVDELLVELANIE
ncbi:hypothetical protein BT96DRAFT_823530, partial [Gymnopus androsaceus JB14]